MFAWLERSRSTPLCIFLTGTQQENIVASETKAKKLRQKLRKHVARFRTVRSDNPKLYSFFKSLLEHSAPALETLSLTSTQSGSTIGSHDKPLGYFSRMQNLHATGWIPSPELLWLSGLKELVLNLLRGRNPPVLQVLSSCPCLERLTIRTTNMSADELPAIPTRIDLPHLREMDLSLASHRLALQMIHRLEIPLCDQACLVISETLLQANDVDAVSDYTDFLLGPRVAANTQLPATEATATIRFTPSKQLSYDTVHRRLWFNVPDSQEEGTAFHEMVRGFQTAMGQPKLKINVVNPVTSPSVQWFLGPFTSENVQSIVIYCSREPARPILSEIGSHSMAVPCESISSSDVTRQAGEWPFESLRSLVIRDTSLNLRELTWLFEIREEYLLARSKRWLEHISLVNCRLLKGISKAAAVEQLAAIGVTLSVFGCIDLSSEVEEGNLK
ncbi:hypothetical protein FRB90_005366 [Tulasnella sp. 427]|nr:hypothetical protein FRB90_005366 [Tulasnella sp. 427]